MFSMFVAGFCAAVGFVCLVRKYWRHALGNFALAAANIWLALGG